MGFTSILFGDATPNLKADMPEFFRDLQLDFLLEQIKELTKGHRVSQF